MRVLILGGTTEASALARRLAERADIQPVLSLAGRTRNPVAPPIPFRVGGFGGIEGLRTYLADHCVQAVVDATHPFAAQMSRHAVAACRTEGVPIAGFTRPPWTRQPDDRWTHVADMGAAAAALSTQPQRVFLTIGGIQLAAFARAPWHWYLVRTIDPPAGMQAQKLILARGPFAVEQEIVLMRDERIDVLVTKNSGGSATGAKIEAARALRLPVVIVDRPAPEDYPTFHHLDAVLAWLEDHRSAP
jgi:precorrin-6A/cobalt-precorrin-6A reductase